MRNDTDGEFLNLHELVKEARLKLNQFAWDYLIGGTETETTLRRNRLALDSIAFRPRVLVDVREVDKTHRFMGKQIRLPVALAPVGSLETFEAGGGVTVAKAATAFNVPMIVSSVTQPGLETTDLWPAAWGPPGLFRPDPLSWEGEGFQAFGLRRPVHS